MGVYIREYGGPGIKDSGQNQLKHMCVYIGFRCQDPSKQVDWVNGINLGVVISQNVCTRV